MFKLAILACHNNYSLPTLPTLVPYEYDFTPLNDRSLLSSLKANEILLTSSVNTLCASHSKFFVILFVILILFGYFLNIFYSLQT